MKNFLITVLAALVINLLCVTAAPANPRADKDAQFAAKVKAGILKLGTGPAAHVEVKLRDSTKLKGYVAEAGERFEPENRFWKQLLALIPPSPKPKSGVLPHPTRFVAMTGFTRSGPGVVIEWQRPTRRKVAPAHD